MDVLSGGEKQRVAVSAADTVSVFLFKHKKDIT